MNPWPNKRRVLLSKVRQIEKLIAELKREVRGHKRGDGICTGCGMAPAQKNDCSHYCVDCRKLANGRAVAKKSSSMKKSKISLDNF